MKHIESILPEQVADELARLLLDDTTISLALKELLHRATGCDIPSPNDTSTSDIEEMIPLCLSILRRLLNTPLTSLGDSTEKQSITDILQKVIGDRVQGNEAFGILPAANENITAAVSTLRQRDMYSGLTLTLSDGTTTSLPDGLSLAQLLCGTSPDNADLTSQVIEIRDSNRGWVMTKSLTGFPNLEKLELGCKENTVPIAMNLGIKSLKLDQLEVANNTIAYGIKGEDIMTFPKLRFSSGEANHNSNAVISMSECRILYFPELQEYTRIGNNAWLKNMPMLEELYMPKLSSLCAQQYGLWGNHIADCEILWKVVYGQAIQTGMNIGYASLISGSCPNLIYLEFGEGTACNIGLLGWSPTNALAERLDEFLYNFQHCIANRVADRTGLPTLTIILSAEVYAVLEAQEGQTILGTLASKNWDVASA